MWAGRMRVAFCGIFDMQCEDVVVGLLDLDAKGGAGDPVCQLAGLRWLLGRNEHEELHYAALPFYTTPSRVRSLRALFAHSVSLGHCS